MKDLEKRKIMPIMPELIRNAMPTAVPQMTYETGIFKDLKHNFKLKRIETASTREANIAEEKNRMVANNLSTMKQMMTFSAQVQETFQTIAHNEQMRAYEREYKQEEINNLRMKNQIMYYEAQMAGMDYKQRAKEMGDESDG